LKSENLNLVQIIVLVGKLLSERRFDELGEMACKDERVLEQLVRTLRGDEVLFCFFAAAALSKAGKAAVGPLVESLQDGRYPVRQAAALALGDIGDLRAVGRLVELLDDKYYVVRQAAAISLGKIGAVEAVEPLLKAIGDENKLVRKAVVDALGMIGDERALPELVRVEAEDTEAVAKRAREVMQQIRERGE